MVKKVIFVTIDSFATEIHKDFHRVSQSFNLKVRFKLSKSLIKSLCPEASGL
jgi:hypothetical protein